MNLKTEIHWKNRRARFYRVVLGGAVAGLATPTRVMLRFMWCKKYLRQTTQLVAIRLPIEPAAELHPVANIFVIGTTKR